MVCDTSPALRLLNELRRCRREVETDLRITGGQDAQTIAAIKARIDVALNGLEISILENGGSTTVN